MNPNTGNNNEELLNFYIQQSSLDNNSIYRKSQNAVKLLPIISNDNGKMKLYTEIDSCIDIGDRVFIMFDQNIDIQEVQIISGIQNSTGKTFGLDMEIPVGATVFFTINDIRQMQGSDKDFYIDKKTLYMVSYAPASGDILKMNYQFIPDIILDNYLEFSGCTSLNSPYLNNWQYLIQTQGYEVLNINESHNEITINRYFNSKHSDKKIYNHYIGKIYVKEINITKGEIDGSMINKLFLNNESKNTSIDINLVQSIILSGISNFVHIKNKYDKNYISLNSVDSSNSSDSSKYNPYTYSGNFISNLDKSPNSSYYSRNNNNYGYSYTNNAEINDNIIENGYFKNCIIKNCEIYGGKFTNCQIISGVTYYGYFINSSFKKSVWINGIWEGGLESELFEPLYDIWIDGIWQSGTFSGKTWMNGIFNNGTFVDSIWKNGTFYGGQMSSTSPTYKKWEDGIFIGGTIKNMNWVDGIFNGTSINTAVISNCNWKKGTFNGGSAKSIIWESGTFNGGLIELSEWKNGTFNNGILQKTIWYDGIFNNGEFNNYNDISFGLNTMGEYSSETNVSVEGISPPTTKNLWHKGTFNGGNFVGSIWVDGIFNNGNFMLGSLWENGIFNNGNFTNSYWIRGYFNNGVVKDSSFHTVEWKTGVFHSGNMGIKIVGSYPIVNWSGGTFNNGIFGQSIYQWRLETGNLTGNTTLLNVKTLSGTTLNWFNGNFYGSSFYNYFYSRNAQLSTISNTNNVTMIKPTGITSYTTGDIITNSNSIYDGTKILVVGDSYFTIDQNAYDTSMNTSIVTTTMNNNGFYNGSFYGGTFFGVFYGGNWVDGTFKENAINMTKTNTSKLETPNEGPSEAIITKSSRKYGSQPTSSGLHRRKR